MAAVIGTLLASSIINASKQLAISLSVTMWSDSQIVLYWLSKSDRIKNLFIFNRVSTILNFKRLYSVMWHYCPTASNPADLLTRGVTLQQLKTSSIWISGPSWLPVRENWPQWNVSNLNSTKVLHLAEISAKAAPARLRLAIDVSTVMEIDRFKWSSLRRATALLFRQLRNFRLKKEDWIRSLFTTKEFLHAELQWILSFQFHFLAAELEYLRGEKNGRRPPFVTQLDLYLDDDLVIRCRGRLLNAVISSAAQNPVLLPKNTDLTRLII